MSRVNVAAVYLLHGCNNDGRKPVLVSIKELEGFRQAWPAVEVEISTPSVLKKHMDESKDHQRHAVIDIGTNSVKLLVAHVGSTVEPIFKMSVHTRLGEGAFAGQSLLPEAIARTVKAIAELVVKARELGATHIRLLATCASREAANNHEFLSAVRQVTRLNVEIISGDEEAALVFRGVMTEPEVAQSQVAILDVGGGSTEFVVGEAGSIYYSQSTKIGTTRLLEMLCPADPPSRDDLTRCRDHVTQLLSAEVLPDLRKVLASFCGRQLLMVGLGGGVKTIARMSGVSNLASGAMLKLELRALREQIEDLWQLSRKERRRLPGLDPQKADVILTGAVIYERAMLHLRFEEMLISSRGVRYGALLDQVKAPGRSPQGASGPGF